MLIFLSINHFLIGSSTKLFYNLGRIICYQSHLHHKTINPEISANLKTHVEVTELNGFTLADQWQNGRVRKKKTCLNCFWNSAFCKLHTSFLKQDFTNLHCEIFKPNWISVKHRTI